MATARPIFSSDPSHIFDFAGKGAGDIFNEAILPRLNAFDTEDVGGLDEAARIREAQFQQDKQAEAFSAQEDQDLLDQIRSSQPQNSPQGLDAFAIDSAEDYNAPLPQQPAPSKVGGDFTKTAVKLSNYGYDSDSSPDYNSNVLRIGNHNNKLVDGVSAALTHSLAKKHGIKVGDMFEAVTSDGKVLKRRYDDSVPTSYKGKALPETVDLYERKGNNNFGGTVVSIRPITST